MSNCYYKSSTTFQMSSIAPQNRTTLPVIVIGDSFARRFTTFLRQTPHTELHCLGSLGISGGTIADLKRSLKDMTLSSFPFCNNILLFIGANNLLSNTPLVTIKQQFISLLKFLTRVFPLCVVFLMELPIFPRHRASPDLVQSIQRVNALLRTLQSDRVVPLSLPPQFISPQFFNTFYPKSRRRDGIHFNDAAHAMLVPIVKSAIQQQLRLRLLNV